MREALLSLLLDPYGLFCVLCFVLGTGIVVGAHLAESPLDLEGRLP